MKGKTLVAIGAFWLSIVFLLSWGSYWQNARGFGIGIDLPGYPPDVLILLLLLILLLGWVPTITIGLYRMLRHGGSQ